MRVRNTATAKKPRAGRKKPPADKPTDPFEQIILSRQNEQAEILKMRLQLDKLRLETLRAIQTSRAKFQAARWKMLNKSMDD
ncbi:MAG: hypothetical protein KF760_13000 [Candidatus Eremiobacteraeota bacterium]|nr:hypothetical protein [Candidatus Eremiobacteraeota bacterium]MCW5870400.1 hypothetical protein [Candidatus Eremiobacteraeota bacterium]